MADTTPDAPWHITLWDSVHALGAAAREHQHAYRSARLATQAADLDRLRLDDATIEVRHLGFRHAEFCTEETPHLTAAGQVGDVLRDAEYRLLGLYEQAALAYAWAATWAVRSVQAGETPARVALAVGEDGDWRLPWQPCPDVSPCTVARPLRVAYETAQSCRQAEDHARALDARPYLADHEAAQLHDALTTASGLPDAAMRYAELAERGLTFVLLPDRRPTPTAPAGADQDGGTQ